MSLLDHLPGWMLESVWLVPAVGLASCGAALLVGWRFFAPRPGTEDENTPLDLDFLKGVTRDRRGVPRRKGNMIEVRITFGDDRPGMKGWVIDRSQGGLCLLVEAAVPELSHLRVRPRAASEQTPWTELIVRSCRAEGHHFELGCQFHRTPDWNLLLQFG